MQQVSDPRKQKIILHKSLILFNMQLPVKFLVNNLTKSEKYENLTFFPWIAGYFIFAYKFPFFCSIWMNKEYFLHNSDKISEVIIFRG